MLGLADHLQRTTAFQRSHILRDTVTNNSTSSFSSLHISSQINWKESSPPLEHFEIFLGNYLHISQEYGQPVKYEKIVSASTLQIGRNRSGVTFFLKKDFLWSVTNYYTHSIEKLSPLQEYLTPIDSSKLCYIQRLRSIPLVPA